MLVVTYSYADGMKAIENFLQNKNSVISADFSQTVYGNKKNQVTLGRMEISRPNKFRWQYVNQGGSDGQLIMSDSKIIYIYDKDLEQVTEKKLTKSLDRSPALLLAGGSNVKQYYHVSNLAATDGIDWVELKPKKVDDNNGFKKVAIGFNQTTGALAQMKFTDSFDNKSSIVFTNVKTGVNFPSDEFKFVVPKDVDVIKDNN